LFALPMKNISDLINKGACNLSTEAKIFQISNQGVG